MNNTLYSNLMNNISKAIKHCLNEKKEYNDNVYNFLSAYPEEKYDYNLIKKYIEKYINPELLNKERLNIYKDLYNEPIDIFYDKISDLAISIEIMPTLSDDLIFLTFTLYINYNDFFDDLEFFEISIDKDNNIKKHIQKNMQIIKDFISNCDLNGYDKDIIRMVKYYYSNEFMQDIIIYSKTNLINSYLNLAFELGITEKELIQLFLGLNYNTTLTNFVELLFNKYDIEYEYFKLKLNCKEYVDSYNGKDNYNTYNCIYFPYNENRLVRLDRKKLQYFLQCIENDKDSNNIKRKLFGPSYNNDAIVTSIRGEKDNYIIWNFIEDPIEYYNKNTIKKLFFYDKA